MSDEARLCPKCGEPVPAEAPQGLCPKCLLREVSIPTEGGKGPSVSPAPGHEQVAAAFPCLEIVELIGQGGMGFVYKARQPRLDRYVALKILPQALAADPQFAERFTREGRVLARLNHPSIVTIHDFGRANGFFYLLMEYVDGVNLRQAMRAGRFTPEQALAIVPAICEALQYAHSEGVLHRDIKPENILLDAKGRVKIADFGIAKLLADPRAEATLTQSGSALGTPHYMAPEQIERPADVDHRADIYSLGVVFYELLTGELPLGRFAPPSQKSTVDHRIDEIVLRALQKERELRQQSAGEVKTQVEIAAQGTAPPAAGTAKMSVPRPECRPLTRTGLLFLALGVVSLLPTFLSIGTHRFGWHLGTLLAMTGIALLNRNRIWWMAAVTVNVLALLLGLLSQGRFILLAAGGNLPPDWSVGLGGVMSNPTLAATIGILQLLGFVAALAVLLGLKPRSTRGNSTSPSLSLNARPERVFLPILGTLVLPLALIALALLWPAVQIEKSDSRAVAPGAGSAADEHPGEFQGAPRGGPFIGSLNDELKVELIALSQPAGTDRSWWKPDGMPADVHYDPDPSTAHLASGSDRMQRQLVFRLSGMPAAGPVFVEHTDQVGFPWVFAASQHGRTLARTHACILQVATAEKTTDIKVGLPVGPWAVDRIMPDVREQTPARLEFDYLGDAWWFELHAEPAGADLHLRGRYSYQAKCQTDIGVLNTNGTTLQPARKADQYSRDLGGTILVDRTYTRTTLAQIGEIHIRIRPYRWAEFRNVSLEPGHLTRVQILRQREGIGTAPPPGTQEPKGPNGTD